MRLNSWLPQRSEKKQGKANKWVSTAESLEDRIAPAILARYHWPPDQLTQLSTNFKHFSMLAALPILNQPTASLN